MAKQTPRAPVPAAPAPAPPARSINLDLTPSPDAREALSFDQQARALVVSTKEEHRYALEFVRTGKQLKRKIEDHWSRIKRSVAALQTDLRDLEQKDLEPVVDGIAVAERVALIFSEADARRVREEEERDRRVREEQARVDREAQLLAQEKRALELEASQPGLSAREAIFVEIIASHPVGVSHAISTDAAQRAGFKNPSETAQRLHVTPKIMDAIRGKREATALREQHAALKQAPLDVAPAAPIQRNTAKVSGVRNVTHYGCEEEIDLELFYAALLAGTIPIESVAPHMPTLNKAATDLKDAFEAAYPGCKLRKKSGLAG